MRVRPATAADTPAMMRLVNDSATAAHWSREQYDRAFGQDSPRRVAWVIEDDAERRQRSLQGFLLAHEVVGEWEIENIVVSEPVRRRGLATQLLLELIDVGRAERASGIFLEVRESNNAARAFYQSSGFRETGRRPRYYSHPDEDAITYRLQLA
jgi:[ribosomal protein S18]-alanine N-acetyltransferase